LWDDPFYTFLVVGINRDPVLQSNFLQGYSLDGRFFRVQNEHTNPHDPLALKVFLNNLPIGFIPKNDQERFKKIFPMVYENYSVISKKFFFKEDVQQENTRFGVYIDFSEAYYADTMPL